MQLDLSADHLAWDGTEAVSYEVARNAAPQRFDVTVAKRRAIRGKEKSPSGGAYVGYELRWLVPARELPDGVRPKPSDVVVSRSAADASERRWTVLTVDSNRLGQTWALGCVDLELANDLRDAIDIQRAALTYDASGAAVKSFAPGDVTAVYAALPAQVQLVTEDIAEERGLRALVGRYEVIVGRPVPLVTNEDRIKWFDASIGKGLVRYLDVLGVRNPNRIDELWVIEAEARP